MTNDDLDYEAHMGHIINTLTIEIALLDAGLLTQDDLDRARNRAIHAVDQWAAEAMNNIMLELKREQPAIAALLEEDPNAGV